MVIKQVRHWMKLRASAAQWKPIAEWAESMGGLFHISPEGDGFVLEHARYALGALRLEWGPSQRDYILGNELRLRLELQLPPELQMMVMERGLQESLERALYDAYTDTLQTRVDTDLPEETRWLVMFSKAEHWHNKSARARFAACGMVHQLAEAWVAGVLGDVLGTTGQDLVPQGHPFVLLTQRGNLYLRMGLESPELDTLRTVLRLAETAAREAKLVEQRVAESGGPWQGNSSLVWPASSKLDSTPST